MIAAGSTVLSAAPTTLLQFAEAELRAYQCHKHEERRLSDQIETLESQCQKTVRATDGIMQRKYRGDGTYELVPIVPANRPTDSLIETKLAALIDLHQKYQDLSLENNRLMLLIEQRIGQRCSPDTRTVIARYYLMGQAIRQIANEVYLSERTVKRIKAQGIVEYAHHYQDCPPMSP